MKPSYKTGLSFGLTSGVITTLGLMVGLHSGTHSRAVVIGGILTIAIADGMSDALGMHIAEESKNHGVVSEIWESAIATFASKFLIAMTFVVPLLLLPLEPAMMVSVVCDGVLHGEAAVGGIEKGMGASQGGNSRRGLSKPQDGGIEK